MKRVVFSVLLILSVLFFASCKDKGEKPGAGLEFLSEVSPIEGDTTPSTVMRDVPAFSDVYLLDAASLEIETGKPCSVTLHGPKCYVDSLKTEVVNGTLFVKFRNIDTNYRKVKVVITMPTLEEVEVTGSELVEVTGRPIHTDDSYIELRNVQNVNFDPVISARTLTISLNGICASSFRVNTDILNLKVGRVEGVSVSGRAKVVNKSFDRPDNIDLNNLKIGR